MPYIADENGLAVYVSSDDPRLATSTIEGQAASFTGSTAPTAPGDLASLEDLIDQFNESLAASTEPVERDPMDIQAEVEALYAYLPSELIELVVAGYIEHGDPTRALAEARLDPLYDELFPNNRREDGSLRFTEQGYASYVERAQIALASINVNPALFGDLIIDAIGAGVQVQELEARIDSTYERVIDRAPAVRQYYATNYEIELTDSAILATALNPSLGRQIIEGQITNAEIGGEAALRGFGIELNLAERLRRRGVTGQTAASLFSQAAEQLPVLDVLARRHNDPDDEFDLDDFLQASIFDDPAERRRIRRLIAQERSSFSSDSVFASDRLGLTGLQAR